MLRIYTASKPYHAPMWRRICSEHSHFIFHARWLKHFERKTPDTEAECIDAWLEDVEDIRICDALFVYALPNDHLRGALVEAGIAIAFSKPVIAIGSHPDYGTWQFHPLVTRVLSINEAIHSLIEKRGSK